MTTDRDFIFTATDILTKQQIKFTLKDLIFKNDRVDLDKLQEDMEYTLVGVKPYDFEGSTRNA